MERRIPIRRTVKTEGRNMTGPRGALATMERKLHNLTLRQGRRRYTLMAMRR